MHESVENARSKQPESLDLSPEGRCLLEKARQHKLGLRFLKTGYPESVAVIHGVHPKFVHEVRNYLTGPEATRLP